MFSFQNCRQRVIRVVEYPHRGWPTFVQWCSLKFHNPVPIMEFSRAEKQEEDICFQELTVVEYLHRGWPTSVQWCSLKFHSLVPVVEFSRAEKQEEAVCFQELTRASPDTRIIDIVSGSGIDRLSSKK